jgi:uncharacterized membrane protein
MKFILNVFCYNNNNSRRDILMTQSRTRKIVLTGILGAISIVLGITHWGFIPWFSGASLTVMHVPVIIGAILEGPWVGVVIGLIFGVFSLIQAAVAPTGPSDVWFTNPIVSVLPRLLIGPAVWIVWKLLKKWEIPALIVSGIAGSLTNTILVLSALGLFGFLPWQVIATIAIANGLPEAAAAAILVVVVVAAWKRISLNKKQGANLD